MAGLYKTYEEIEAAIAKPRSYGADSSTAMTEQSPGAAQISAGPQAQPTSSTSGDSSSADAQVSTPLAPTKMESGTAPSISLSDYTESPEIEAQYKDVFSPFTKKVGENTSSLKKAGGEFTEGAGSYRTFTGIQGANQIQQALSPDTDPVKDQAEMDAARSLVNASYEGPTQLDQKAMDEILSSVSGLRDAGRAFGTAGGTQALLQERTRTPASQGELDWEAQRYLGDEGYLRSGRAAQGDIESLSAQIDRAQREAAGIAAARKTQEEEIASSSRGILEGETEGIASEIAGRVTAEEEANANLEELYNAFLESGDLETLDQAQAGAGEAFRTPGRALAGESDAAREAVMGQFQDLSDVPLMVPQINTHGFGVLGWSPEDYAALQAKYDPETLKTIRDRSIQRQRALEAAGFSQGLTTDTEDNRAVRREKALGFPQRHGSENDRIRGEKDNKEFPSGQFSAIDPIYKFGSGVEKWDPLAPQAYTSLNQGTGATRENLATDLERERYARASDILGLQDRILKAETPYEKASIAADGEKYLDDEIADLERRKGALDDSQARYLEYVKKQRSRYRKAKRKEKYKLLSDVLTLGMGPDFGVDFGQGLLTGPMDMLK